MTSDTSCNFLSPNGDGIIGTSEAVWATVLISGIDTETGDPQYNGGAEVHWETQETLEREGKIIFVCSEGKEWTFDQLVPATRFNDP